MTAAAEASPKGAQADLSVRVTDSPDPVRADDDLVYSITVRNLGPATASEVIVRDVLPAKVNLVSIRTGRGSCSGNDEVVCRIGGLTRNGSIQIVVRVTAVWPGTVRNTATVTANEGDPDYANNSSTASSTVKPPIVDLSTKISDAPDPVEIGTPLTYSVVVRNGGPSMATDVTVRLNAAHPYELGTLIYQSGSVPQGKCSDDGASIAKELVVTCWIDHLDRRSSTTIKVVVIPTLPTVATRIEALVRAEANEADTNRGNDSARALTTATSGVAAIDCAAPREIAATVPSLCIRS